EGLISESVRLIDQGSGEVVAAGNTMTDIVDAVKRVTDIMLEIAAASDEQSRGIVQVSQAISEMDKVTQQNASLVEEASAAAASLEEQAARLTEAVGTFRLTGTSAIRRVTPAVHPSVSLPKSNTVNTDNWETF
ncbi:methyl-accepting chemotaxis protein, partial [Citrobacter freundii]